MNPDKAQEFKEIVTQIEAKDENCIETNLGWFDLNKDDINLLARVLPNSRVLSLNVCSNKLSSEMAIKLAKILQQTDVASVDFSFNDLNHKAIIEVVKILLSSKVTKLELTGNALEDEGAIELSKLLIRSQFTHLEIGYNKIDDKGLSFIIKSLPQCKIKSISLKGNSLSDGVVNELAQIMPQSQLECLYLTGCRIKHKGLVGLAKNLSRSNINTLDLGDNELEDGSLAELFDSLPASKLTTLILNKSKINDASVNHLASVILKSKIKELNLSENKIGAAGALALAKALPRCELISLNLRDNKIGNAAVIELADYLPRSKLSVLDLSKNDVGITAASALANALPRSKINKLEIWDDYNYYDEAIPTELSKVLNLSNLTNLDLEWKNVGLLGMNYVAKMLAQGTISSLNLANNKLGPASIIELIKHLPGSKVNCLNMDSNVLGNEGISQIAKVLPYTQINTLKLGYNKIEDAGAIELAKFLPRSEITYLDLSFNEITHVGLIELANVLEHTKITHLILSKNFNLKAAGVVALAKSLPRSKVTTLKLESTGLDDDCIIGLAKELPATQITVLDVGGHFNIGDNGAIALVKALPSTHIIELNLQGCRLGPATMEAFTKSLPHSKITNLNLYFNELGDKAIIEFANALPNCKITFLDLSSNKIGNTAIAKISKLLPNSRINKLFLRFNNIGASGVKRLASILSATEIVHLDLGWNKIGDAGIGMIADILHQTKITDLYLSDCGIGPSGVARLAQALPHSKVINLDLRNNKIGNKGIIKLAEALSKGRIRSLSIDETTIRENSDVLLDAIKANFTLTEANVLSWGTGEQYSIFHAHLEINKLLSADTSEGKSDVEFARELATIALMHIRKPQILDDVSLEKPKRLLLKAKALEDKDLDSAQSTYLLGKLYLEEYKNIAKAKEYYLEAAAKGHGISKLCLQLIEGNEVADSNLMLNDLVIKLPRRINETARTQKDFKREQVLESLNQSSSILVSKSGISLAELNRMVEYLKYSEISVYIATKDYESKDASHLSFSKGQAIYIPDAKMKRDFVSFVKDGLTKCFIPFNRDPHGNRRSEIGFIPYHEFITCQLKSIDEWSAEDVCNAYIIPWTKPKEDEQSKPYVDRIDGPERGKPFDGYILSYARSTKFGDILKSLNEHFKDNNLEEIFIWIDLIGINQHAWMKMKSEEIGKILEEHLTQLFTYASKGRLIHFDKANPTNLTRSWCLVELLSCLKAQEETTAQTEICMTSEIETMILSHDLMELLNSLDSSKAQCFNPADKSAIDWQIRRALTNEGEHEISMEIAYARLNNVVKGWLINKFLPDFSSINALEIGSYKIAKGLPLTLSYDIAKKNISADSKLVMDASNKSKKGCVIA